MAMDLPKEQSQKELAKKSSSSKVAASLHKIEHKISKRDQKKQLSLCKGRILPEGLKVSYISKGKTLQTGYTKGRGIFCDCCKRVVSPTMFESHAGKSSSRKPYQHIYLASGLSLHQHASSKKLNYEQMVENNNDLICMVCHKSKNLLYCEGCPKSFHKECIAESSNSPESSSEFKKRFCNQCEISMKCLTPTANAMENGRVYEVGPVEDVEKHGLQIIDDTCDLIACVLCRSCEYNVDVFCDQTSIVCDQCEKEYHIGCLREVMDIDLQELPLDNWFCSADCASLNWLIKFSTSQPLKVLDSYMEAVKKKLNDSDAENIRNLDIKWIVFNCKDACEENKLLITQAVDLFHDCFNPIIDSVTEKDFISSMAYGEQMGSLNFSGVYAALITINSKVVTAGMFRTFGREIAELPIVATSQHNQGKGYLHVFLICFERLLSLLHIKKLVISATDDARAMWIKKFGFSKVNPKTLSEYRQTHTSMVVFQGTTLLQRNVEQGLCKFRR